MVKEFFAYFDAAIIEIIGWGILETLYMVLVSTFFAYLIGLPLGVVLILTDKKGMHPVPWLNGSLNIVVNILRSIPFIILFVAMMPGIRVLIGKSYGPTACVVGLVVSAFPFVARLVEQSLQEVDGGVVEAALSMGASPQRILWRVMLPEAAPSLIVGCAIAATTILGYSAMGGFVGSGGLGDLALKYGHLRYESNMMIMCIILLVIIVQAMQELGMRVAKSGDKRNMG